MKRTSNKTLADLADAPDLNHLVQDKRGQKRATSSKGRRRNRRYENRLLNSQTDNALESPDLEESEVEGFEPD